MSPCNLLPAFGDYWGESAQKGDSAMEDSQIIDLYWQRSERAIAESESRYGRYCHAIAFNFTLSHEDA